MRIYVIRHGETVPNTYHLISGDNECDLTENGIIQAQKIGRILKNVKFNLVMSSPLSRAIKTAEQITNEEIIIDERLKEFDYGDYEGKQKKDIKYEECWDYALDFKEHNGETLKHLMRRISNFIEDINKKYPSDTILLSTHSGVARAIHYYLKGIPKDNDLTSLEIYNCSIRVYDVREMENENIIS